MTLEKRFEKFARECGLCNERGEYPTVVSVVPDSDKKEEAYIITVLDSGVSQPLPIALDKEIKCLQHHLGGIVYDLSFSEDTTQARFGLLLKKGEPHENL